MTDRLYSPATFIALLLAAVALAFAPAALERWQTARAAAIDQCTVHAEQAIRALQPTASRPSSHSPAWLLLPLAAGLAGAAAVRLGLRRLRWCRAACLNGATPPASDAPPSATDAPPSLPADIAGCHSVPSAAARRRLRGHTRYPKYLLTLVRGEPDGEATTLTFEVSSRGLHEFVCECGRSVFEGAVLLNVEPLSASPQVPANVAPCSKPPSPSRAPALRLLDDEPPPDRPGPHPEPSEVARAT